MNNKLMYGADTAKDWYSVGGACRANDVPQDNLTKRDNAGEPKVSIPSPFARFELVQKAFYNFSTLGAINCDTRDRLLVSHTLDLMELFYENPSELSFEIWEKNSAIQDLNSSSHSGNRLFGAALDQYSRQENYGFQEKNAAIAILKYGPDVIGCASPTSIFMATPRYHRFNYIKIEGSKSLFDTNPRMLFARDDEFVEYVYRMASLFVDEAPLEAFVEYLTKMKEVIRSKNPDLYRVIATFPNKELSENLRDIYEENPSVQLFGKSLFCRPKDSVMRQLENNSAFVLQGAKGGKKPLILTNNCPYTGFAYTSKTESWNSKLHSINYSETVNAQKRATMPLPGTSIAYEWLCENDLLSDIIVQLPYKVDGEHFFYGDPDNLIDDCGFLLPLKSKFFDYFNADYLRKSNGNTKNYKIEVFRKNNREIEKVVVYLSLQITGGKPLTLKKTYFPTDTVNDALSGASGLCTKYPNEAVGYILECPIAISLFPFARVQGNNMYRAMLERGTSELGDFQISLIPRRCEDEKCDNDLAWASEYKRTDNSTYYSINETFDYMSIKISDGGYRTHYAVCVPVWPEEHKGSKEINFAFDFGTTNSHIAIKDGSKFLDFKLDKSVVSTILPSQNEDVNAVLLQLWMRQEFLPKQIGTTYKFPLRSVVLKPHTLKLDSMTPQCLEHVNIPFVYGKEDYNESVNEPKPNLKWSNKGNAETQMKLANAFIEEMVFLSRAFALEYGADLKQVHITWTYPLSMRATKTMHDDVWKPLYVKYFNPNMSIDEADSYVSMVTESIAPMLYYSEDGKMQSADMELSVDIGGGTCDVVLKNGKDDIKINSFRFAADVIFDAGKAHENQMIQHWAKKMSDALSKHLDPEYKQLLMNVCSSQQPASEANSLLFALETLPKLANLPESDKSYNARLKSDGDRKILFIYFYGAIVYYLAKLLNNQGCSRPGTIYFSGTGSKLLNIIGGKSILEELTTRMLEKFGGFDYDGRAVRILIESREPKQLTAKGALAVSDPYIKPSTNAIVAAFSSAALLRSKTLYYSVTSQQELTNADVRKESVLNEVVSAVKDFNEQFLTLAGELDFVEEHGCNEDSIEKLGNAMKNCDLLINLKSAINDFPSNVRDEDALCESLFFYPIKSILQSRLV